MTSPISAAADRGCTALEVQREGVAEPLPIVRSRRRCRVVRTPSSGARRARRRAPRSGWSARPSRSRASPAPAPPSSAELSRSARSRRCTSAPARTRSRCSATSLAASRSASVRSSLSGRVPRPRSSRAPRRRRGRRSRRAASRTRPAVGHRLDEDRLVAAVELAEDPALVEDPRVALGHLAAEDRLDPGRVGLVLAAGEGEHPGAAVLDGDRRVEQRGDALATANRSPDGRPPSDSGRRRRRRPRRAASAASPPGGPTARRGSGRAARHPDSSAAAADVRRQLDRARSTSPAARCAAEPRSSAATCVRVVHADAEHERVLVAAPAGRAGRGRRRRRCRRRAPGRRGRDRAGWRRGRRGPGRGWREARRGHGVQHLPTVGTEPEPLRPSARDRGRFVGSDSGQSGEPLGRGGDLGEPVGQRRRHRARGRSAPAGGRRRARTAR